MFLLLEGPFGLGRLIVPTGTDEELAEEFFGGGVNDPDMQILDQEDDGGSSVGSPHTDVVEFSADPFEEIRGNKLAHPAGREP